ncbi:hypothetical protein [Pontibacter sp. H249]|uniref:hypothetical protein n=1 Tax=Pontibacter sp. H249 TaxID=3133420 RepID=UPI0030BC52F3
MSSLERIEASLKVGQENFSYNNQASSHTLIDFWRWSASSILSNTTRGHLAEFIVATATNIDIKQARVEWDAYDLLTPGGIKIEVKSAAYLLSWKQDEFSKISFSIKPTRPWDWELNKRAPIAKRSADVYVFCLLHHADKATIDPLNMDQWEFYVLATEELNNYKRSQHSITLNSLKRLTNAVKFDRLYQEIKIKNSLNCQSLCTYSNVESQNPSE